MYAAQNSKPVKDALLSLAAKWVLMASDFIENNNKINTKCKNNFHYII